MYTLVDNYKAEVGKDRLRLTGFDPELIALRPNAAKFYIENDYDPSLRPRSGRSLIVSNLPILVHKQDVINCFRDFDLANENDIGGEPVIFDLNPNRAMKANGTAMVTFQSEFDAYRAMQARNNSFMRPSWTKVPHVPGSNIAIRTFWNYFDMRTNYEHLMYRLNP
ncbi:hypothetical protein BKA69DRAFT_1126356 [Paraphysoderma sedebokerense]|nr:hypothetical protein BKA69DRAFT_1126356 [Paraphysoderma sedebokerense]